MELVKSAKSESLLVVAFCALSLFVLGKMINDELVRKRAADGSRAVVAKLSLTEKTVQRKLDREVLWDDMAVDELLYQKDAVRTSEQSRAKITFDDGTILELAENSLVVLDRSDDKLNVEFVKGSISAAGGGQAGHGIAIQTQNGKVELGDGAGGKGALNLTSGSAGLELTVLEGAAKVKTASGEAQIGKDEKGKLGAGGGLQKQKVTIKPELPMPASRFIAESKTIKVPFSWQLAADAVAGAKVRLQISQDTEFTKGVTGRLPAPGAKQIELEMAEGTYYWRAQIIDADGKALEQTEPRLFRVQKHSLAQLDAPAASDEISFFKDRPVVQFSWRTGSAEGGIERVEVSDNKDFSKPLVLKPTRGLAEKTGLMQKVREAKWDQFVPGKYFWRVVTRYEGTGAEAKNPIELMSETRTFSVAQLAKLPVPTLLEPKAGTSFGMQQDGAKIAFRWKRIAEAKSYRLTLASDEKFKNAIRTQTVTTPEWDTVLDQPGKLFWKVEAIADDQSSEATNGRVFQIVRAGGFKTLAPKKQETFSFLGKKPKIQFKWEAQTGAEKYEVQFSRNTAFKDVIFDDRVKVSDPKQREFAFETDEIPAGEVFWRVRALSPNGDVLALSETANFAMKESPVLAAPEKVNPAGAAVIPADPTPKVKFEWKTVAGAKAYQFELWKKESSGKLEKDWNKEIDAAFVEKKLDAGSYQWTVRSIDQAGRVGAASPARVLVVKFGDRLAAPKVLFPAANQKIEKPEPETIKLKWESVDGAKAYEVIVEKTGADGKTETVVREKTTDRSFVLPESTGSGSYSWKVVPVGIPPHLKDDPKLGVEKPGEAASGRFEVKWTSVLAAPSKVKIRLEADRVPAGGATK
ncbi:MAG: FecR domain-containing protein [Bdellovibrionales bacterium]|nr:FecR domain-containing protein [Bdellovibrionales bacterium]